MKTKKIIDRLKKSDHARWSICTQDWEYKLLYVVLSIYQLNKFIASNDLGFYGWYFTDSLDWMKPDGKDIIFACPID